MALIFEGSELNAGDIHTSWNMGHGEMTAHSTELKSPRDRETHSHQIRHLDL